MDTDQFYLGKIVDPQTGQAGEAPLYYDPADLTTHSVVVGMTGSGKTGLCIGMLEEAALLGIPALMIDPKGDITNTLLHFPDLLPGDFQPWVNADQARREGKTLEQAAAETATRWREGLTEWGISNERLRALQDSAQFAVYTPGSDAGIPVSILSSLKCPPIPWQENREILREKIVGTVTALLGLVGLNDIDPVRSREHILLSNIFEKAWSSGKDLDLGELILQTQTPPFPKLGVFDVNTFFPEKDRFELAMLLNNILAAPAFQTWIEGEPLDIGRLLFASDGRPRHCVFYVAHLSDSERMFFITLLYSAVETWMRSQPGTNSLRAILYFDEIFGYLPPQSNPPSKQPMLRMLKQARAFGVGQVLVTQNPVDVDYKGLSNAGSWFIGKLQTDQDKQRLLDGLDSALTGGLDRAQYDRLISTLGKRVFLLHNVHAKGPQLFQTRWAMNYLAGPLTRTQIPALNEMAGVSFQLSAFSGQPSAISPSAKTTGSTLRSDGQSSPSGVAMAGLAVRASQPSADRGQRSVVSPPRAYGIYAGYDDEPSPSGVAAVNDAGSAQPFDNLQSAIINQRYEAMPGLMTTRPSLPAGVKEYFLPNNLTFTQAFKAAGRPFPQEAMSEGLVYRPVILAQADVRFLNRKYNLDSQLHKVALVFEPDRRGLVRWEDHLSQPVDASGLEFAPDPQAKFVPLEAPFSEARTIVAMQKDFLDWVYRTAQVSVRANEALRLYSGPEVSQAEFRTLCTDAAREGRDAEARKVSATYDTKIDTLQTKLNREERELAGDQTELSQRKWEEGSTHLENVASVFGLGRKRSLTTSLTRRRLTEKAKAEVEETLSAIQEYKAQVAELEREKAEALEDINQRWGEVANQVSEIPIAALKKDVLLDLFGVAWMPFHIIRMGTEVVELPGFGLS